MNPYEFIEITDCEFSKMQELLLSTDYYVLHHNTVQKGKQIFKKGRLVVAHKEAILTFFQKECQQNEEAMFFIMPKHLSKGQILLNTEDWNFYAIDF